MFKDLDPELIVQADEMIEDFVIETSENDVISTTADRFNQWLEIIDN